MHIVFIELWAILFFIDGLGGFLRKYIELQRL